MQQEAAEAHVWASKDSNATPPPGQFRAQPTTCCKWRPWRRPLTCDPIMTTVPKPITSSARTSNDVITKRLAVVQKTRQLQACTQHYPPTLQRISSAVVHANGLLQSHHMVAVHTGCVHGSLLGKGVIHALLHQESITCSRACMRMQLLAAAAHAVLTAASLCLRRASAAEGHSPSSKDSSGTFLTYQPATNTKLNCTELLLSSFALAADTKVDDCA